MIVLHVLRLGLILLTLTADIIACFDAVTSLQAESEDAHKRSGLHKAQRGANLAAVINPLLFVELTLLVELEAKGSQTRSDTLHTKHRET